MSWIEVPQELARPWRDAFNTDLAVPDLAAPCPRCGAIDLHRWYRVDGPMEKVISGIRVVAHGCLWEWCATCHLWDTAPDAWVPDFWVSPYDVPNADRFRLEEEPEAVEMVRRASGSGT